MAKKHYEPFRIFKRGKIYHTYISIPAEGAKHIILRESTGCLEAKEAEFYSLRRIKEIQEKLRRKRNGELDRITIDDAFTRYFSENGQYLSKPEQIISRLITIKNALPVKYLDEIDEVIINNFKNQFKDKMSDSTINRYLAHIGAVVNTAKNTWKVKTTPIIIQKFKYAEPDEVVKFLPNWEEAQRIIDKAAKHLQPIIYTALYTGLRLGNLLNLKWENINFSSDIITVKIKSRKKQGGKNHTVPIIPPLREILMKQPRINEYVFNFRGKHINSVSSSWNNIFYKRDKKGRFTKELKDITLPYINFHILRHTAATWVLRATKNLKLTKEILGHSDIKTTLKYAHILDEEKRDGLNAVYNV